MFEPPAYGPAEVTVLTVLSSGWTSAVLTGLEPANEFVWRIAEGTEFHATVAASLNVSLIVVGWNSQALPALTPVYWTLKWMRKTYGAFDVVLSMGSLRMKSSCVWPLAGVVRTGVVAVVANEAGTTGEPL